MGRRRPSAYLRAHQLFSKSPSSSFKTATLALSPNDYNLRPDNTDFKRLWAKNKHLRAGTFYFSICGQHFKRQSRMKTLGQLLECAWVGPPANQTNNKERMWTGEKKSVGRAVHGCSDGRHAPSYGVCGVHYEFYQRFPIVIGVGVNGDHHPKNGICSDYRWWRADSVCWRFQNRNPFDVLGMSLQYLLKHELLILGDGISGNCWRVYDRTVPLCPGSEPMVCVNDHLDAGLQHVWNCDS